MNNVQVIEIAGQRVLTTKQIADAYETTEEKIRWNFKYNRNKYVLGKHYILIEGEELRKLKRECEFQTLFKQAKSVCLWTEKGALLHAKSVNTDRAWMVYENLVDFYFRHREEPKPAPSLTVATQPIPIARMKSSMAAVVDVPVNDKAQNMFKQLRDSISGIEAVIGMLDRYLSEENYQKTAYVLMNLCMNVGNVGMDLYQFKPGVIEKVL